MGTPHDHVSAGILMNYGTNQVDQYRQAGVYVGRSFSRLTKPANLPVVQATKFELLINATTAKAIDAATE